MVKTSSTLSKYIKTRATDLGFSSCGIALVRELSEHQRSLHSWLDKKYNAEIEYMQRNEDKRLNPVLLVDGAKSVVSFAMNYFPEQKQNPDTYQISKYAYGKDYHKVLKDKLHILLSELKQIDSSVSGRVFVDSAPVLERAWAVEAGLGWIGKNGLLIIPQKGSFFFLCEMILNVELEYDKAFSQNFCGTCRTCIDACPNMAIVESGIIDSRKCISYVTIEKKGEVFGNELHNSPYIFGCDICQDVCPWNHFSKPHTEVDFVLNSGLQKLTKSDFENLSVDDFNVIATESPLSRAGYTKLKNTIHALK